MQDFYSNNKTDSFAGKVIIAGAGCGDPGLITVKAALYLQQAEVVLVDRLVSKDIIRQYVNTTAQVMYVGKQCRKKLSTPQQTINELMVQYAKQGKRVVRLKGGDVAFFSNMLDELAALRQHQVPYEIVPGITAASGAAAYAGMPLTARGLSAGVRFLTAYKPGSLTDHQLQELATTSDTLVFYMSSVPLDDLVAALIKAGIADDKQLAVIEQATTPDQYVVTTSINDYETTLKGQSFISPSLVVVGDVVALHHQYAWKNNPATRSHYFTELESKLANITHPENEMKHVTRA